MPDYEVAIVGGGPVGMLLASLLSARGIETVVFERGSGRAGSRAIGIHPPGLAALDAAGIGEAVRAEALAVEGGAAWCRGRRLASLTLVERPLVLPQSRTERLLRERLDPGVLRLRSPVIDLVDEGDRVCLDLGEGTASARLVVAADGVRSGIRNQLGIPWRRRPGSGTYVMTDAPTQEHDPWVHLLLEPEGVVESFPLPGGMRRWVARVPDERPASGPDLAELLERRTGARVAVAEVRMFTAQQHAAGSLSRGRVALLGDAAHEVSPIGGQGMNLGWIGAVRLASALAASLHRGQPSFEDYERTMRSATAGAHRRARFNMTMGAPRRGPALVVRNAAVRTLGSRRWASALTRAFTMRDL